MSLTDERKFVLQAMNMRKVGPVRERHVRPTSCAKLQQMTAPHVESFNFFLGEGLTKAIEDIDPMEAQNPHLNQTIRLWFEDATIGMPRRAESVAGSVDKILLPHECREGEVSYRAAAVGRLCYQVNGTAVQQTSLRLGLLPIMVKSSKCHLRGMSAKQLVAAKEDANEMGGYFIINGIEKVIRLMITGRRNHPMAMSRPGFESRGPKFTKYGVLCRSVRPDQTSSIAVAHYLSTGDVCFAFTISKNQFFIPAGLLLKAMRNSTDKEIFDRIVQGDHSNTFLTERVELLLRESQGKYPDCQSQEQCLSYLGSRFRPRLALPASASDAEVGIFLLKKFILVHAEDGDAKFDFGILMLQKLFALVQGRICEDSSDSPMNQEVLLPGHVFLAVFKEKMQEVLQGFRDYIVRELRTHPARVDLADAEFLKKMFDNNRVEVGRRLENFLATGNFVSKGNVGLTQQVGYTIVGEKLNFYRYLAHFRSIHRGQIFTEMKTTSVRKLMPDAWGFLCPVHTPDGAPCGLLNHLSHTCIVSQNAAAGRQLLEKLLVELGGMACIRGGMMLTSDFLPVVCDGYVLGHVASKQAASLVASLRFLRSASPDALPHLTEIAYIPQVSGHRADASSGAPMSGLDSTVQERLTPLPGLFLFTGPSRMMRPVRNLTNGQVEYIGSLEQLFMDIACLEKDIIDGVTTHIETEPTAMLSVVASLTPFSDFNQSPRNMYQCQMAKQTMATPVQSFPYRTDNKMYRLMYSQTPISRTRYLDEFELDNYPHGINAVVAVISYTGYDMEDAMIINKGSYERGLFHGTVYTTTVIDLAEKDSAPVQRFSNKRLVPVAAMAPAATSESGTAQPPQGGQVEALFEETLDADGLPPVGLRLEQGNPFYCVYDSNKSAHKVFLYKYAEPAVVEEVRFLGVNSKWLTKASIKLRFNRNPVIGDKFSSRHGQKGTLSQLWPQSSMPFSEYGMTPDIIINPHAFPSRMTIGMLIESMSSKAGALHGFFQDASPFQFDEDDEHSDGAVHHFGKLLRQAGFNYYGNEPMYSGTVGVEMQADIYMGVVYYQRLRHMVKDKFQVRSTGPVHELTQQPVHGRKVGGGIRLGEMERDSLLAHGVSYLLQDRLLHCSDKHKAYVCRHCRSLLGPTPARPDLSSAQSSARIRKVTCTACLKTRPGQPIDIDTVTIPYVFKYLVNELAAVNIRIRVETAASRRQESVDGSADVAGMGRQNTAMASGNDEGEVLMSGRGEQHQLQEQRQQPPRSRGLPAALATASSPDMASEHAHPLRRSDALGQASDVAPTPAATGRHMRFT